MILSHDVAGHIYFTSKFEPRYIPNQKRDGRAEYFIIFFSKQTSSCIQYKNIVIVRKNNFKSGERHHINAR